MNLKSDIWLAQRVTLPMAQPSQMEGRMRAVLASRRVRKTLPRSVRIVAAVVMLSLTAVLAALRPVAQATPISPISKQPTLQAIVVVDAGHGGKDTGAVAADGTREKDLNLSIARKLGGTLGEQGIGVAMTRTADVNSSILQRLVFAARHHPQLVVSLHCDSRGPRTLHGGTVVYYHQQDALGRRLALDVLAGLSHHSDLAPYQIKSDTTRFPDGFGILRGACVPAVLVECGAMNNARDLAALCNSQERQNIAEGIAAGIRKFQSDNPLSLYEKPVQQASRPMVSAPPTLAQATARLKQIYGFIQVYRRIHGGAYPANISSPGDLMGDMAAHPKSYSLPDRGVNNVCQAMGYFSINDISDEGQPRMIRFFTHSKRPDGAPVGSAKQVGTRDVLADYTVTIGNRNLPGAWRLASDYLVLWDDGQVTQVPAEKALGVPVHDFIGGGSRSPNSVQVAFSGQAGLPAKGVRHYERQK